MEAEFDNIDENEGGMILFKVRKHFTFFLVGNLFRNFAIGPSPRISILRMILTARKRRSERSQYRECFNGLECKVGTQSTAKYFHPHNKGTTTYLLVLLFCNL